jgi:dynactin complex subunit
MDEQTKNKLMTELHRKLIVEIKMLKAEYEKNIQLVNQGINVFADRPGNSPYECEGCGS